MAFIRSLLFAAAFYTATVLWVLAGIAASLFGTRPTLAVVLSWVEVHHWLIRNLLGIRIRVAGTFPPGQFLYAVKHQAMLETLEMLRLVHVPAVVMKRELADIPLFGALTRRYGVIVVDREAGASALRDMLAEAKAAVRSGRPVVIFPEGTRVRPGDLPPLRPGFAGLYRALGLPVVPVAVDSGRLWGRGFIHRAGTVTFHVGEIIPPGLKRDEIDARVHRAINAFELAPEARA